MLKLLLICWIFKTAFCSCRSGFQLVKNGQCTGLYQTLNLPHNDATNQAIAKCNEIQGTLPIIHNQDDYNFWSKQKRGPGNSAGTVLGILCDTNTKKWKWVDGSAVNFYPPYWTDGLRNNCKTGCIWFAQATNWYEYCDKDNEIVDIYCVTHLPPRPVPSADGCDNFQDDGDDGVCYQVGTTASNWQEAQMICRSFGADVASIHSVQENSFVRRLAVSKGAVNGMYLGATISGKGNDFGWIDGSEWDYENFFPGFPLNGLGECLIMDTSGSSGQWVNVDCSTELSVACIRQQHYTTPACSSGPYKEGQIIYSPGYPFDASIPCDFILSVDTGKKVEAEILFLEANGCCDNLILFENYFGGNVIANLTGEVSKKIFTTNSSNFMRVSWLPNGGVNVQGMMMTFRGV